MSALLQRSAIKLCKRNQITGIVKGIYMKRNLSSIPELTRIRYPDVKRGNYAQLQKDDVIAFNAILDPNRVVTEESDLEGNLL